MEMSGGCCGRAERSHTTLRPAPPDTGNCSLGVSFSRGDHSTLVLWILTSPSSTEVTYLWSSQRQYTSNLFYQIVLRNLLLGLRAIGFLMSCSSVVSGHSPVLVSSAKVQCSYRKPAFATAPCIPGQAIIAQSFYTRNYTFGPTSRSIKIQLF